MDNLLRSIIDHESFESRPYPDPLSGGAPFTFGHGLTYITESESLVIVRNRIATIRAELSIKIPFYLSLPDEIREVLEEMAFQLGVNGLLGFKKTFNYLRIGNFARAADEMLDSAWAKIQTPKRAKKLSARVRKYSK